MKIPVFARYVSAGAFALAAFSVSAVPAARAFQGLDEAASRVRSPEDLARWLSREFAYTMNLADGVHSPEATIGSRSGDCDDFAILASEMLTRMGVENQVLVLRFRGMIAAHAICVWKDREGRCSFISNRELCRTGKDNVEDAVRMFYPDCETIASIDPAVYMRRNGSSARATSGTFRGAELMADLDPRISTGL